jgi:hypothetical protein
MLIAKGESGVELSKGLLLSYFQPQLALHFSTSVYYPDD